MGAFIWHQWAQFVAVFASVCKFLQPLFDVSTAGSPPVIAVLQTLYGQASGGSSSANSSGTLSTENSCLDQIMLLTAVNALTIILVVSCACLVSISRPLPSTITPLNPSFFISTFLLSALNVGKIWTDNLCHYLYAATAPFQSRAPASLIPRRASLSIGSFYIIAFALLCGTQLYFHQKFIAWRILRSSRISLLRDVTPWCYPLPRRYPTTNPSVFHLIVDSDPSIKSLGMDNIASTMDTQWLSSTTHYDTYHANPQQIIWQISI